MKRDIEGLGPEQKTSLKTVSDKVNQLGQIIEGLSYLTRVKRPTADVIFEEVEMGNTLEWVVDQVRDTLEQHDIHINVSVVDRLSPISIDRRTLTECLLYLIKHEIQFLPLKSRLDIRAADVNEKFLTILIINPLHQISQNASGDADLDELRKRIYPAKLMLQGLGGKLNVTSEKEEGTIYTLIVPKRWHSWMQETSSLQQATETVRKEAQSELINIRHLLSSISEQVPPSVKYSLERIKNRIQELGVLCNRTLFLTEDLNSRLEIQQESLLQQDIEQLASLEAILAVGREMARSMNLEWIFKPERAEFVSKYALSIAKEYKLSESDCQSLLYAAMIDDLGLVLSPQILTELVPVSSEESTRLQERFYPMWKALSGIPFLRTAILYLRYIYNMYGIDGSHSDVKRPDIPLGAKILYLVSSFERLVSGQPSQEKLSPNQALNKITNKSGWCFEPYVLNTFLQLWRRQTLYEENTSVTKLNNGF
jgi:HD-GYP domain-containing protein (c-di-GMP phosphodiesterase class II)